MADVNLQFYPDPDAPVLLHEFQVQIDAALARTYGLPAKFIAVSTPKTAHDYDYRTFMVDTVIQPLHEVGVVLGSVKVGDTEIG